MWIPKLETCSCKTASKTAKRRANANKSWKFKGTFWKSHEIGAPLSLTIKIPSLWVPFENFMRKKHIFGYILKFFFAGKGVTHKKERQKWDAPRRGSSGATLVHVTWSVMLSKGKAIKFMKWFHYLKEYYNFKRFKEYIQLLYDITIQTANEILKYDNTKLMVIYIKF